jgi:hypothetical protein
MSVAAKLEALYGYVLRERMGLDVTVHVAGLLHFEADGVVMAVCLDDEDISYFRVFAVFRDQDTPPSIRCIAGQAATMDLKWVKVAATADGFLVSCETHVPPFGTVPSVADLCAYLPKAVELIGTASVRYSEERLIATAMN